MSDNDEYIVTEGHAYYEEIAARRRAGAEYREGYREAERAFRIGLAVRERRLVLGLSQAEPAAQSSGAHTWPG